MVQSTLISLAALLGFVASPQSAADATGPMVAAAEYALAVLPRPAEAQVAVAVDLSGLAERGATPTHASRDLATRLAHRLNVPTREVNETIRCEPQERRKPACYLREPEPTILLGVLEPTIDGRRAEVGVVYHVPTSGDRVSVILVRFELERHQGDWRVVRERFRTLLA